MTVMAAIRIVEATCVGADEFLVIGAFTLLVKARLEGIYWDKFSLLRNHFQAIISGRFDVVRLLVAYVKV